MDYNRKDANTLFGWLLASEAVLATIYLITAGVAPDVRWGPIGIWFDVDRDFSIPSWFSTVQLFLVGLVLLLTARNNRRRDDLPTRLLVSAGLVFVLLSADEGAGIHERITSVMARWGFTALLFRGDHGGWIGIYVAIAVILALMARRWLLVLWRDFRHESTIALLGAALYVTGAVVIEIVGYQFATGTKEFLDVVRNAAEELLEMSGVSVLLYATLLLGLRVKTSTSAATAHEG